MNGIYPRKKCCISAYSEIGIDFLEEKERCNYIKLLSEEISVRISEGQLLRLERSPLLEETWTTRVKNGVGTAG